MKRPLWFILLREAPQDERTFGVLTLKGQVITQTMEPGFADLEFPRVPAGFYACEPHGWPPHDEGLRFRKTWALAGTRVLPQADRNPGFPGDERIRVAALHHGGTRDEHTRGCILHGVARGTSRGEPALLEFEQAMNRLRDRIGPEPFYLSILEPKP